jgi:hypothetical protein
MNSLSPDARPAVSKRSQQDRESLRKYLVTVLRPQKESRHVPPSIKEALADAIPLLGNFLGRRKAVVAGTTVSDSQGENTKREALFQQQRLLSLSATYMESAPWISSLTATKHARFMECYGLTTSAFADFGDKTLVDETTRLADELDLQSSALMDPETTELIRKLIDFQGRQERLTTALSVVNEMISSPYRAFLHSQLTNKTVEIARHHPTLENLPDGSKYMRIATTCLVAGLLGLIAASKFFATKQTLGVVALGFVAAIGFLTSFVNFAKAAQERGRLKAEEDRCAYESSCEDQRINGILILVIRLAGRFRTTVKTLLDELSIPINLDDLEGMLSVLVTYRTWGLETESRYTKT